MDTRWRCRWSLGGRTLKGRPWGQPGGLVWWSLRSGWFLLDIKQPLRGGGTHRPSDDLQQPSCVFFAFRYFLPGLFQGLPVQSTPDPHGSLMGRRDYCCPILRRSRQRGEGGCHLNPGLSSSVDVPGHSRASLCSAVNRVVPAGPSLQAAHTGGEEGPPERQFQD